MKLNKIVLVLLLNFSIVFASMETKEKININFKDLKISDLIKVTSKIIGKNILLTHNVKGKVDFVSNKPVYKDDILNILMYVLEEKGYTIIENAGILRIVRSNSVSKYNIPVYSDTSDIKTSQMITEVFAIEYSNVDYITAKIRHLISKSAKLVTDKTSNSIIITDFLSNINTIKKVISIISLDAKKTIEIIPLKNIQAADILTDITNVSKNIFNEKIEKEKVAILANKDNNSIMFVGKKKNVDYLKKYLIKIDTSGSLVEKVVEVIYLKNAEAKNLLKILTTTISNKKFKDVSNKPFASTDEESNAIILMGQKEELKPLKELIAKLDIDRQQVYVKAKIIEVSELKTREIGVKYGLAGYSTASSLGLSTFTSSLNSGGNVPMVDVTAMSSYGYDITTMKNALSLGMSLNLLNQNGAADIVSEPSLLCINNKQSSIYVGETRSIKTGTTTSTGGVASDKYSREDIGLTLKVKPRISNGNKVLLEISTKLEDVGQTSTNGNPNTSKKDIQTTAIVNNGESIILGGYIKSKKEDRIDKVPLFGDIPVLGRLFRNRSEINDKINLVIVITPYIVPKTKDLTYVRNQLDQLKLLEDKYTKDTILRLEKAKLKVKKDDLEREEEKILVDKKRAKLKDKMLDFAEDKSDYENDKKEELAEALDEEEKLNHKKVKDMFGL